MSLEVPSIKVFLNQYHCLETYNHCLLVGEYAYQLAVRFSVNPEQARVAGYLHDISAIYPNQQRVAVAKEMGIALHPEELVFPMIIHQKISREIALKEFNITDPAILSAIECPTILKGNYSKLDLVVFFADKVKWDQVGRPPYFVELLEALVSSLEAAAYYYIEYLLAHDIKVKHPWLLEGQRQLETELWQEREK